MSEMNDGDRLITQGLDWGSLLQERRSPASTLWAAAGRSIYVLGNIDGRFRPLTNAYDLHAYGKPHPDDPLAGKLQGVWAQPVKGFAGYGYSIDLESGECWVLDDAERFTQSFAFVRFDYRRGALEARRVDFASVNLPVLFSTLALANRGERALEICVRFRVDFDLEDAWFTSLAGHRNTGESVAVEGAYLVARALAAPQRWAAVAGGPAVAALPAVSSQPSLLEGSAGELLYRLRLEPGAEIELTFGMAIESQGGAPAALDALRSGLASHHQQLAAQTARFDSFSTTGPRLDSPDPRWNAAFLLAHANLQMLEAEQKALGRYFYAGLEIFPFWFSNDGAYSVPGLMSAGLSAPALNHVRIGKKYLEAGRVPHQISPSAKVAFPGNAPESPLWIISIWDAYRWSGDGDFLAEMYPAARDSLFHYVLGTIDADGDGYPSGPGTVEVEGMGEEKLDSAAYTWAALHVLSSMAAVLGKPDDAAQAAARADALQSGFDADWWDAAGGTYAMSLKEPGNSRYPVMHWAVIVPLEVGLATAQHAAATFATLRRDYLNRWGLKHTVGDDERVWTLPTATLSRAAYRFGEPELGFEMLGKLVDTLDHGSIGLFHELIPEGACFLQLWSAATFLRGVIEDLMGVYVSAADHRIDLSPRLPAAWGEVSLNGLVFGGHQVSITITSDRVTITHQNGPAALICRAKEGQMALAVGETGTLVVA